MSMRNQGIPLSFAFLFWSLTVAAGALGGFCGGYSSGIEEGYRRSKGTEVKPVAVADFNNDGINDIIYKRLGRWGAEFVFVDGRYVSETRNMTYIHSEGSPIVTHSDSEYNIIVSDIDGDGNLDISTVPADTKAVDSFSIRLWGRYGDGHGNFDPLRKSSAEQPEKN